MKDDAPNTSRNRTVRTVAVVAKQPQVQVLDTMLDAGDYDVVFVESFDRAYSSIKRVTPDLVIVCLEIDEIENFHLLSMLALDKETADIRVCTYVVPPDATDADPEDPATLRYPVPQSAAATRH